MEPGEIGPVSAPAEFFQNPWVPKAECCFSAAPHLPSPFGYRFAYSDYGRHRQNFLRTLLSNHILIKNAFDLGGFSNILRRRQVPIMVAFFRHDIVSKIDALH